MPFANGLKKCKKKKCSKEEKYAKAVSKWKKGLDEKMY